MLTPGTVLIQEDALRPSCFHTAPGEGAPGWAAAASRLTSHALEQELANSGWTFFYMAGAVTGAAFGFDRAKMLASALRRVVRKVSELGCNSLEIDDVTARSFLGVPYVSILAHPRHIQKGLVFSAR